MHRYPQVLADPRQVTDVVQHHQVILAQMVLTRGDDPIYRGDLLPRSLRRMLPSDVPRAAAGRAAPGTALRSSTLHHVAMTDVARSPAAEPAVLGGLRAVQATATARRLGTTSPVPS